MTNEQPEALRLAELLEAVPFIGFVFDEQPGVEDPGLAKDAAAELRRLHAELEVTERQVEILTDALAESRKMDVDLLWQALEAFGQLQVNSSMSIHQLEIIASVVESLKERLK